MHLRFSDTELDLEPDLSNPEGCGVLHKLLSHVSKTTDLAIPCVDGSVAFVKTDHLRFILLSVEEHKAIGAGLATFKALEQETLAREEAERKNAKAEQEP